MPLDWRVEKMRLSNDKTQLRYNSFLTLDGIPGEAFAYRLGNRSALEWVIDHFRVKTDKRSGIINDPNRADDPQYILRLIGKVVSVSLETVGIVAGLPELGIDGSVSDWEGVSRSGQNWLIVLLPSGASSATRNLQAAVCRRRVLTIVLSLHVHGDLLHCIHPSSGSSFWGQAHSDQNWPYSPRCTSFFPFRGLAIGANHKKR